MWTVSVVKMRRDVRKVKSQEKKRNIFRNIQITIMMTTQNLRK